MPPTVTNRPISTHDEGPQPVAHSVNAPARVISKRDEPRPEIATGDPESIAAFARREAERAKTQRGEANG